MSDVSEKIIAEIAGVTQARLEHGKRTQALTTAKSQAFALDHARAQAAVHSTLDVKSISKHLSDQTLQFVVLKSAAETRDVYIKRPDLGRKLSDAGKAQLGGVEGPFDVALVLGDGLSSIAANLNGPVFIQRLSENLSELGLRPSPVILAEQARVALGDQITFALNTKIIVMALGERPGLSAADSLGVYVTYAPNDETQDSERNCISNIREAGLSIDEAVAQTLALIADMQSQKRSGVALQKSDLKTISG